MSQKRIKHKTLAIEQWSETMSPLHVVFHPDDPARNGRDCFITGKGNCSIVQLTWHIALLTIIRARKIQSKLSRSNDFWVMSGFQLMDAGLITIDADNLYFKMDDLTPEEVYKNIPFPRYGAVPAVFTFYMSQLKTFFGTDDPHFKRAVKWWHSSCPISDAELAKREATEKLTADGSLIQMATTGAVN